MAVREVDELVAILTGTTKPTDAQLREAISVLEADAVAEDSADKREEVRSLKLYRRHEKQMGRLPKSSKKKPAKKKKSSSGKPDLKDPDAAPSIPGEKTAKRIRREGEQAVSETIDLAGLTWRFLGITLVLVIVYMIVVNSGRVAKGLGTSGQLVRSVVYPNAVFGSRRGAAKTKPAVLTGRPAPMIQTRGGAA